MHENPDRRPIPSGCATHFDTNRKQWYYVHLQTIPPRVTYIHPDDETPPLSSPQNYSPARGSTPQQQQQQQTTSSFQPSMYNQTSSSQQQPSRLSPIFSNPMPPMQYPVAQQQQMYGLRQSFGQNTPSVQDYTSQQHQNFSPPENNPSPFAMHRARQPSEAQSMYGTSIPQSLQMPSDNRFSIYSTTNGQATSHEVEFDASILYTSPVSASTNSSIPAVPVSNAFHPNRRQEMSLDDSEYFSMAPSNQATYLPRSQTIQVSDPATRRFQSPNVLRRRKVKAASSIAPIPLKPAEPPAFQKPNDVPVYNLVAQAPLDTTSPKSVTPSFQTSLYARPPIPHMISDPIQNSGSLQLMTQHRTQSLPPISTSNQESTIMQGLLAQNSSSMPSQLTPTSAPATTSGSMSIPQQPLSPLRGQSTGTPSAISPVPYMNSQILGSNVGLSNGTMGAPLNSTMNHTSSLMSMSSNPLDGYSNGTMGAPTMNHTPSLMSITSNPLDGYLPMTSIPPMTLNQQPQSTQPQLNGFSNGLSGAPLISPMLMLPQPQEPDNFSNGLSGNITMAQPLLAMPPLQPNMLIMNGYAQGLPPGASAVQTQGGMTAQIPEISEKLTANDTLANKRNKQIMKKVGLSLLKFGAKYTLGQIGVDEDVAAAAVNVAASGVQAAANAVSNSNSQTVTQSQ